MKKAKDGWKNYADALEPIWSYGDVLPPSLVDLIEDDGEEDDDEDLVEEYYDIDEILEYLDDEDDE